MLAGMRRLAVILLLVAAACGESRSEKEAKRRAEQARIAAEEIVRRERVEREAQASRYADEVMAARRKAEELARATLADASRARALGEQAKAELDKVYRTSSDYDLDITTAGATSAHAEKLAAMPHVTVNGVTVGYEEDTSRSLGGASRRRHFRATWRRGDRDVIVGYQTEEKLDLVAFAKLLQRLVPIVERLL